MILPYDKFSHRNEYLQRKCDLARREKNSTEKPWFYDGYGYRARLVSVTLSLLWVMPGRERSLLAGRILFNNSDIFIVTFIFSPAFLSYRTSVTTDRL